MLTMLEEHLRDSGAAKIMERSIHSDRFVFIESFRQAGNLMKVREKCLSLFICTQS